MAVKILRKLPDLGLEVPPPVLFGKRKSPQSPKGMIFVLSFLRELHTLEETESSRRVKNFLLEKHKAVFGLYPNAGVSLQAVKARVAYRLQMEGHKITGTEPSPDFLRNYNAVVGRFRDERPFEGCTEAVKDTAVRLALHEGDVSMSTIKKAAGTAKKAAKVAAAGAALESQENGTAAAVTEAPAKEHKVRGKVLATADFVGYSGTEFVRILRTKFKLDFDKARFVCDKFKVDISDGTIKAQLYRADNPEKYKLDVPAISADVRARIDAVIPSDEQIAKKKAKEAKLAAEAAQAEAGQEVVPAPAPVKAPAKMAAPAKAPVKAAAAPVAAASPVKAVKKIAKPVAASVEQL